MNDASSQMTSAPVMTRLKSWCRRKITTLGLRSAERELIERIRERRLTYLSFNKLAVLAHTVRQLETRRTEGVFLEAGCALGGSAILMASLKQVERPLNVYDVFGQIPPPSESDTADVHERYETIAAGKSTGIGGDEYYGYQEDLFALVKGNLREFDIDTERQRVSLIKGLLQETMHIDGSVALAHVDVDWYDPVLTCLRRIFPHLSVGGSIVLDDYYDWGGCRKAADEYLATVTGEFALDGSAGSMKVTRTRPGSAE